MLKKVLFSALFGAVVMMGSAQAGYLTPSTLPTPSGQAPPPALSGVVTPVVPPPLAPGAPAASAPLPAGPVGATTPGAVGPVGTAGDTDGRAAASRSAGQPTPEGASGRGSGGSGGSPAGSGGSGDPGSSGGSSASGGSGSSTSSGGSSGGSGSSGASSNDDGGVRAGVCVEWLLGKCVRVGLG